MPPRQVPLATVVLRRLARQGMQPAGAPGGGASATANASAARETAAELAAAAQANSRGRDYTSREMVRQWQPPPAHHVAPRAAAAAWQQQAQSAAATASAAAFTSRRAATLAARAANPQLVNHFMSRAPSSWLAVGAGALTLGVGAASHALLSRPPEQAAAASRAACAVAAAGGALGVASGAFGFHGLRAVLQRRGLPSAQISALVRVWSIGVHYQLVHCAAVLAATPALLPQTGFLAGVALFSGSLQAFVLTGSKAFQYLTPFGGLAFIGGWSALAAHHAGVLPLRLGGEAGAAEAQGAAAAEGTAAAGEAAAVPKASSSWWRSARS